MIDELATLAAAEPPMRNHQLFVSAIKLARNSDDRESLRNDLVAACHVNGLVADDGLRSVEATITSAFRVYDS